jgi:hypothetical protein
MVLDGGSWYDLKSNKKEILLGQVTAPLLWTNSSLPQKETALKPIQSQLWEVAY